MRKVLALLAFLLWPALGWAANCTITGKVYNPDGTPLSNGTVNFNSLVQQTLQGGATVPPTQITTTTGTDGTMAPITIVQGLQGQFVFCSPSSGGCGNPTPVLIPVAATADISSILIGIQLSSGGNVVASSLNVTGNSTMAGTLNVTGATTLGNLTTTGPTAVGPLTVTGNSILNGTINVSGAATVGTLTAGVTTMPSLTLTQTTGTAISFSQGSIISCCSVFDMAAGAHYNGSSWVADQTTASMVQLGSGALNVDIATGLTVGNTFTFTPYLTLTTTYLNGEFDYNGTSILQVANNNGGTAAIPLVRAANGTHVVDLAMPGTAYSTGSCCLFAADRAYLSSNGANGLLIESTGAAPNSNIWITAPNGNQVVIGYGSHFDFARNGTASPTVSSCGSGATIAPYATDNAGWVQTGTSTSTCVLTFGAGWTVGNPACSCTSAQNTWCSGATNGSQFSMAFGTPLANQVIMYQCLGAQ